MNLIGDHTDYNEGFALPMATNEGVTAVDSRTNQERRQFRIESIGFGQADLDINDPESQNEGWARFAAGIFHLAEKELGPIPSCQLIVGSTIPARSGLSSSAAFAIALIRFIEHVTGKGLSLLDCAKLAQHAEHKFAGVPCGLLDQLAILHAQDTHAALLDFRTLEATPVRIDLDEIAFLIIHSGVHRSLSASVYQQRHDECMDAARALGVNALRDIRSSEPHRTAGTLTSTFAQRVRHIVSETIACTSLQAP